jgi:hypothetical protein
MVVGWAQIKYGTACPWVIRRRAKLKTPLDNVCMEGKLFSNNTYNFSESTFFGTFIKIQEIQFAFNCTSADGNGFKTSTMRLGADVLVFSRSHNNEEKRLFSVILATANCINHTLVGFISPLILVSYSLKYAQGKITLSRGGLFLQITWIFFLV